MTRIQGYTGHLRPDGCRERFDGLADKRRSSSTKLKLANAHSSCTIHKNITTLNSTGNILVKETYRARLGVGPTSGSTL